LDDIAKGKRQDVVDAWLGLPKHPYKNIGGSSVRALQAAASGKFDIKKYMEAKNEVEYLLNTAPSPHDLSKEHPKKALIHLQIFMFDQGAGKLKDIIDNLGITEAYRVPVFRRWLLLDRSENPHKYTGEEVVKNLLGAFGKSV